MWKKTFYLLSLGFGLILGAWGIAKFGGLPKALAVVREIGWVGLGVYLLNASLTLIAPAIGWWILARGEGSGVRLGTTVRANLMGFPVNFLMPSLYLGAEPLKVFYVAGIHGEPKSRILATIIVAKFQELGGHIFVMLGAAGISLWRLEFTRRQETLLIASMGIICALFALTLYAFAGNLRPTVRIINALAGFRIFRRRMARLRSRAEEMERLIHEAFTRRWRTFLAAQVVTLFSALSVLVRPLIFFGFTRPRVPLPVEHLCSIFLITNVINILPHTPGALGLFELGMLGFFSASGIGRENAAAYSLVSRTADLALLLLGGWLMVHAGLQAAARRLAGGAADMSLGEERDPVPPSSC